VRTSVEREGVLCPKRRTVLVLLVMAAVLTTLAYFSLGMDVPTGARVIPVEVNLDW
jgi:hypothetical protein